MRQLVRQRTENTCECCRVPQQFDVLPFQVDHIIPEKHHGPTAENNLALSCYADNTYKGPNIAGIDPEAGQLTRLFHPRQDERDTYFEWNGLVVVGRTAIGRATIDVLKINLPECVEHRRLLIASGIVLG